MGKNYVITSESWVPLSDVMGQDYDHTVKYGIHVNEVSIGLLRIEYTTTVPTDEDRGRELPQFSVIYVPADTGDDVYLRASNNDININVFEITG